jgi:hypothetical protein
MRDYRDKQRTKRRELASGPAYFTGRIRTLRVNLTPLAVGIAQAHANRTDREPDDIVEEALRRLVEAAPV